ncbi:MAG: hypothetical protein M1834_005083 [Cirrosporium novae-zelandiae]|nr:MAG: hypothetical protein M1834_005083 [Cirrosporium novae-zelandiae]
MRTTLKEVSGIDWGDGAVMNCVWRGPKLRDVLTRAGVAMGGAREAHVAFASFQIPCQEEGWYGGSITLEKAMRGDGDVILALEMNEHALSAAHGAPVRIIAPGIAGARSVKWLDQISVQLQESQNYYQIRDYKVLPPEATDAKTAEKFWKTTPALQEMPINSVIAYPAEDSKVKRDSKGAVQVGGYALPQGDQGPVTKVEISVDDGRTWQAAQLITEPRYQSKWCWVLWKATVKMSSGSSRRFLSRAIDAGGNVQTAHPKWNFRGVAYNGYGESKKITIL